MVYLVMAEPPSFGEAAIVIAAVDEVRTAPLTVAGAAGTVAAIATLTTAVPVAVPPPVIVAWAVIV